MTFARISVLAVCFAAAVASTAEERFRVVLVRAGRADINIRLEDVNDGAVDVPFGSNLTVTAHNGQARRITAGAFKDASPQWQQRIVIDPLLSAIPEFEVRSDNRLWPDDVTVTASLQPPNGAAVPAKPLLIPVPPHPLIALALALLGAVLLALLPLSQVTTPGKKAATIGAALVAGTIAFFAADSKTIWKFVGFQDETPLRPQSYFLLGIAISALGVRPLIEKITGSKPVSSLTPEEVRDQVVGLLSGDTVRAPFRDEVRAMLFDSTYVRAHPEIVSRLETALADAKDTLGLPEGLADHLAPRLDHIYAAAYRRDYHIKINAALDVPGNQIAWQHGIYYEYIPRLGSAEPEISFRHAAEVPLPLRSVSSAKLSSFGMLFRSLNLTIQNKQGGDRLVYVSNGATLTRTQAPAASTAPATIPVQFGHDEALYEAEIRFEFTLPAELKGATLIISIDLKYVSALEDGVYNQRVSGLTTGCHLNMDFTPPLKLDIAVFEWKVPGLASSTAIDNDKGEAHLPGWLLPGNGVCVAWHGTKNANGDVKRLDAEPRGVVRRVLGYLPLWPRT